MFNDTKIVLYSNKVIFYNYRNIIKISTDIIIIDNWSVNGEKLQILELDSYNIVIRGIILGISSENKKEKIYN